MSACQQEACLEETRVAYSCDDGNTLLECLFSPFHGLLVILTLHLPCPSTRTVDDSVIASWLLITAKQGLMIPGQSQKHIYSMLTMVE